MKKDGKWEVYAKMYCEYDNYCEDTVCRCSFDTYFAALRMCNMCKESDSANVSRHINEVNYKAYIKGYITSPDGKTTLMYSREMRGPNEEH